MARRTKNSVPESERVNIVIYEEYTLRTKLQKRALVPQEAIDKKWFGILCQKVGDWEMKNNAVFVTSDGHRVRIKLIACCNNSNGGQYEWLQNVAEQIYGLKFEPIQSNWFARLGNLSGYWHVIDMEEVI